MSVYLDASVLVPLFVDDVFSERADALLLKLIAPVVVADFAAAEFASAISRKMREKRLTRREAQNAFSAFDAWTAQFGNLVETQSTDVANAAQFLRRLDMSLRTPDALNLAIARRLGAAIATFDEKMAGSARRLKLELEIG